MRLRNRFQMALGLYLIKILIFAVITDHAPKDFIAGVKVPIRYTWNWRKIYRIQIMRIL